MVGYLDGRELGLFVQLPTAHRLPPFGNLDVSVTVSFYHSKTPLNAPMLTRKRRIPEKFSPLDPRSQQGLPPRRREMPRDIEQIINHKS